MTYTDNSEVIRNLEVQCDKLMADNCDLRYEIAELSMERDALRTYVRELGGCPGCRVNPIHDVVEPFSSCKCGTQEDYGTRPAQRVQVLQAQGV